MYLLDQVRKSKVRKESKDKDKKPCLQMRIVRVKEAK